MTAFDRSVICVAPPHVYRPRVDGNSQHPGSLDARLFPFVVLVSLYTILLLPILFGRWHTDGRSREGRILPNSRAIVMRNATVWAMQAGRKN